MVDVPVCLKVDPSERKTLITGDDYHDYYRNMYKRLKPLRAFLISLGILLMFFVIPTWCQADDNVSVMNLSRVLTDSG